MKVLHVIDALGVGGGAEHSLAVMLPLLRDLGVESNVACLIPREGGLQEQLRSQGFDVEVLAGTSLPAKTWALRRKIRRERPDIVHASLLNSCMAARFASPRLSVRQINSLVNTSYDPRRLSDLGIPAWKLKVVQTFDGFTARHMCDCFHAITEAVKTEGVEVLGIAPEKITVIPRGRSAPTFARPTDEIRSETRKALGVDGDDPVILNVGRQDNQKGQADLIQAFASVLAEHPRARLLIAGREGNATAAIQTAIAATGTSASVSLLGHRTDIPELLLAADMFVFPSIYEGLGGSLIEAMSLGVPIIGSDAPAVSEVLGGGRYGEVVRRGGAGALAEAMNRLMEQPDRARQLGDAGRRRFIEWYGLDLVVARMRELYLQAAG